MEHQESLQEQIVNLSKENTIVDVPTGERLWGRHCQPL